MVLLLSIKLKVIVKCMSTNPNFWRTSTLLSFLLAQWWKFKCFSSNFSHQTRLGFKYYTMPAALAVTKNLKKVVATKKGKFGHNSEVSLRNIILLFACEFFSLVWICFHTISSPWEKICFLCKEFWKVPSRTDKNTCDDVLFIICQM